MKPRVPRQQTAALTLVEVLVVVVLLIILAVVIRPISSDGVSARNRICVNNLKQIAHANWVWANEHDNKFPMQVSVTNGGAKELALTGDAAGIFRALSNRLYRPNVLWCPADKDRLAARNWTNGFSAANISYFVGTDADESRRQMFLSGDDNFAIGGVPVKPGLLELSTNAPLAWTTERHISKGNIGLADGSVASTTSSSVRQMLMEAGAASNRLAIP